MRKLLFFVVFPVILVTGCNENVRPATEKKEKIKITQELIDQYNASVTNPDDEVVCKRQSVTGTRLGKLVCHTRGQLKRNREEAKRLLDRPTISTERGL